MNEIGLVQALFAVVLLAVAAQLGRKWVQDSGKTFSLIGAILLFVWGLTLLYEAVTGNDTGAAR